MIYQLKKKELLEKSCELVIQKLNITPFLVFIDMTKYIDEYYNSKIKVYVVANSKNDIFLDEYFTFDSSTIHLKVLKLETLLNCKRYKIAMTLANITDSIAVINNNSFDDLLIYAMNSVTPFEIMSELCNKTNYVVSIIEDEKKLNSENKLLIVRTIKYIKFFTELSTSLDVLNSYYRTTEYLRNSKIVEHLTLDKPIMEKVVINDEEDYNCENMEMLKMQLKIALSFMEKEMKKIKEEL